MESGSENVHIAVRGAVLAGTLLVPPGEAPRPCLLLVSGSGTNDRDETVCGHKPFRVIAEYFAGRGYVVLRCDDRGVGQSTGNAAAQDFEGSVADVVAVCQWLGRHPAVDPARVVLLGHSEGALVAAASAPQTTASAVAMLAGPAVPIEQLLHEQARTLSIEAGATPAQVEHEQRMNARVFALARSNASEDDVRLRIEAVIREALRAWPDAHSSDESDFGENARVMAAVVSAPAYRSFLRQEPAEILGRLDRRFLAVYGGKDCQVPGPANAAACRQATLGHTDATVRIFPGHNHLFQPAHTGAISEYEELPAAPDTAVLQFVVDWLEVARAARRT